MSGLRYWMYCGEQDFVRTYGAAVATRYRDPTGTHGRLVRHSEAMARMFAYFDMEWRRSKKGARPT